MHKMHFIFYPVFLLLRYGDLNSYIDVLHNQALTERKEIDQVLD